MHKVLNKAQQIGAELVVRTLEMQGVTMSSMAAEAGFSHTTIRRMWAAKLESRLRQRHQAAIARPKAANALNLLPLSAEQRTWPDLLLARPGSG
jgi:hypothetical protein